jgi:hypothetical protein
LDLRGLTPETYGRLMAALGDRTGAPAAPLRPGGSTRSRALVKCTSATAAGGSDLGDTLYPGIILDINSEDDDAAELEDSEVWLTVYGAAGVAETPVEDGVYSCELVGVADGDGDERPRAIAADGAVDPSVLYSVRSFQSSASVPATTLGTPLILAPGKYLVMAQVNMAVAGGTSFSATLALVEWEDGTSAPATADLHAPRSLAHTGTNDHTETLIAMMDLSGYSTDRQVAVRYAFTSGSGTTFLGVGTLLAVPISGFTQSV